MRKYKIDFLLFDKLAAIFRFIMHIMHDAADGNRNAIDMFNNRTIRWMQIIEQNKIWFYRNLVYDIRQTSMFCPDDDIDFFFNSSIK